MGEYLLESVYLYLGAIFYFVYLMILFRKRNFGIKEWLMVNLTALVFVVLLLVDRAIPFTNQFFYILGLVCSLLFFLCKIFHFKVRIGLIIAAFSSLIIAFIESIAMLATYVLTGYITYRGGWYPLLLNITFFYVFGWVIALLFRKPFTKALDKINANKHLQKLLLKFVILLFLVLLFFMNYIYMLIYVRLSPLVIISFFVIVVATTACLIIYILYLEVKSEYLKQEQEANHLEYYTNELEQQQISLRKFRHDYQNIFLSIKSFIDDGDLAGLEKYYGENITFASKMIMENDFTLDSLHKIKVREIKSILASKVIAAQNLGRDTKVVVEVNEEIEEIPIESITLVRMLGIILDNAVEAISERDFQGDGSLYVGIFKWSSGITIIIENTCSPNVPPLEQIYKSEFSTKGKGHGLGLVNLLELANQLPNLTLGTIIEDDKFRQELLIENL